MTVVRRDEFLYVVTIILIDTRKCKTWGRAILIGITTINNIRGTLVTCTTSRGREDMATVTWCVMHVVGTDLIVFAGS